MLERIINVLIESKNLAADDLLLGAMDVGNEKEGLVALDALLKRGTIHGLSGLIERYARLKEPLKLQVLDHIKILTPAIRACATTGDLLERMSALKLIALGRQGKLAYLLIENMHHGDTEVSQAAVDAMVALARWVATETRKVQALPVKVDSHGELLTPANPAYRDLIEQRPEIESTISRAIDIHRGEYGQDLLRAALLLADRPESQTLSILQTPKHGGQVPMVRRLQQSPASEHVDAFLLAASHMDLRSQFGVIFSRIDEAPVLDAILRRTHWLKDNHLRLCMQHVNRGHWLQDTTLRQDTARRSGNDLAAIGEWLAASDLHDAMQDPLLIRILEKAREDFAVRIRLFRIAMRAPIESGVAFLRELLKDGDERLVRMAVREFIRRRPADYENILLQLMTNAPDSVRRLVGRSVGQNGFDSFWERFDSLDPATRQSAGRAMVKILPNAVHRLSRLLMTGTLADRLKAMQITHELGLSHELELTLTHLINDPNPKLRSRAVALLGQTPTGLSEPLIDKALNDPDARVRANAIEAIDQRHDQQYLPVLSQMARSRHNRERANAIKALHSMRVGAASQQLITMLHDEKAEHRISAIWALRQVGLWQMLKEVAQLAKSDADPRVRRYAVGVIRALAASYEQKKASA
ncbi:MAG TPA: HEAT repeat domain-containing protein [Tepidisphaeraceae bacterium]